MARVNVEQTALSDQSDPRFKILGKEIGVDRWSALGRMCAIWNLCQERETYVLDLETVNFMFDDAPRLSDALLKSGLAKKHRHGIYISGSRGRVEWLGNKRRAGRENGKLGGRPKKTKSEPIENQNRLLDETPPAPAPAPAPALNTTPRTRGSRLPEPFDISEEMRTEALKKWPTLDVDAATEDFRNVWRGRPGKDGVRVDWAATWRNGMQSRQDHGRFQRKIQQAAQHRFSELEELGILGRKS